MSAVPARPVHHMTSARASILTDASAPPTETPPPGSADWPMERPMGSRVVGPSGARARPGREGGCVRPRRRRHELHRHRGERGPRGGVGRLRAVGARRRSVDSSRPGRSGAAAAAESPRPVRPSGAPQREGLGRLRLGALRGSAAAFGRVEPCARLLGACCQNNGLCRGFAQQCFLFFSTTCRPPPFLPTAGCSKLNTR